MHPGLVVPGQVEFGIHQLDINICINTDTETISRSGIDDNVPNHGINVFTPTLFIIYFSIWQRYYACIVIFLKLVGRYREITRGQEDRTFSFPLADYPQRIKKTFVSL